MRQDCIKKRQLKETKVVSFMDACFQKYMVQEFQCINQWGLLHADCFLKKQSKFWKKITIGRKHQQFWWERKNGHLWAHDGAITCYVRKKCCLKIATAIGAIVHVFIAQQVIFLHLEAHKRSENVFVKLKTPNTLSTCYFRWLCLFIYFFWKNHNLGCY